MRSVAKKQVLVGAVIILILFLAFKYFVSAGGLTVPDAAFSTNYKCTVNLHNPLFRDVQIKEGTVCGATGSCLASGAFSFVGAKDAGNMQMIAGGKTAWSSYALWESGEEQYELNVCGASGANTAKIIIYDDAKNVIDTREVGLL